MGVLGVSLRPVLMTQLQQNNEKITQNKHRCIAESLAAYVLQHRCLPEASMPSQSGHAISGKYIGIIPYKVLNLDQKMVKDQNGFWFTYAVNRALTQTCIEHGKEADENKDAVFCTIESRNCFPKIKDQPVNEDCIAFVLVAHYKGNGALKANDTRAFYAQKDTIQLSLEALNASDTGTFSSEHVRDSVFWISRYNLMAQIAKQPCAGEEYRRGERFKSTASVEEHVKEPGLFTSQGLPNGFVEDLS